MIRIKMYFLLILVGFVALINGQLFGNLNPIGKVVTDAASPLQHLLDTSFNTFQSQYKKVYDNPQIAELRKGIFKDNLEEINEFNKDFEKGVKTFQLGINEFIDLTTEEFNRLFNGFGKTRSGKKFTRPRAKLGQPPTDNIPTHIDWRQKSQLGPIKHQKQCASCYAFSAAAAVECQIYKKTGKLLNLSPQNILDCSSGSPYENDGCNGGYPDESIQYMIKSNGINNDNDYPYEAQKKQCRFKATKSIQGPTVIDCLTLPAGDEKALEAAVANIGPISVAMDASHSTFKNYINGIYYEPKCGNGIDDLNHAILVIGYGIDEKTGQKYWLCKNTYGTSWGENGYFRIVKEKNNHCGIATWPVYPVV